jgi:hypothetical protein
MRRNLIHDVKNRPAIHRLGSRPAADYGTDNIRTSIEHVNALSITGGGPPNQWAVREGAETAILQNNPMDQKIGSLIQ